MTGPDQTDGASAVERTSTSDAEDAASLAEENARLRAELDALDPTGIRKRRTVRRTLTAILVVLASVCVLAATLGVWTQRTLADEDSYLALVGPLAEDPQVTQPLAARLTSEVILALDVRARVATALAAIPGLPDSAAFLAGPLTEGAENLVAEQVTSFLASDRFAELWVDVNRVAHQKVQALLNGDYDELPNVVVSGGDVRLNLVSLTAQVIRSIAERGTDALGLDVTIPELPASLEPTEAISRLSSALGVTLPENFGQVTIMSAEDLGATQDAVRSAKRLVAASVVLSLILIAAALLVAVDRRRAVVWLGVGIAATLFLGGVFLRRVREDLVESITGPAAKAAANDVFDRVGDSLRSTGRFVVVVALVAAVVAYLVGRPRWFVRATTAAARLGERGPRGQGLDVWLADHGELTRGVAVAGAALILFITGIGWISIALVGVALALVLIRVSRAEARVDQLPDAAT